MGQGQDFLTPFELENYGPRNPILSEILRDTYEAESRASSRPQLPPPQPKYRARTEAELGNVLGLPAAPDQQESQEENPQADPQNAYPPVDPSETAHPFLVLQRPKPDVEGVWQYGVIYESSLYKSLRPNDKQTLTGLLSEDGTTGWFDLAAGGYIWLEVSISNLNVITAEINNSNDDDFNLTAVAWSGIPTEHTGYVEDNEETTGAYAYKHAKSRKLVAYTVSTDAAPALTQCMFRDQVLRNVCIGGRPALYPFDHEGGYPL